MPLSLTSYKWLKAEFRRLRNCSGVCGLYANERPMLTSAIACYVVLPRCNIFSTVYTTSRSCQTVVRNKSCLKPRTTACQIHDGISNHLWNDLHASSSQSLNEDTPASIGSATIVSIWPRAPDDNSVPPSVEGLCVGFMKKAWKIHIFSVRNRTVIWPHSRWNKWPARDAIWHVATLRHIRRAWNIPYLFQIAQ